MNKTEQNTLFAPLEKTELSKNVTKTVTDDTLRIIGYDIARGIAILTMLIINFKGVLSVYDSNPQWLSDVINFLDRRAAIVLVMVSGIGLTLLLKASDTNNCLQARVSKQGILLNRAFFLFISGYLLSIIWSGDILHFYAIFICLGIVLSPCSNKFLAITASLIWMASFIQFFEISDHLQSGFGRGIFIDQLIDIFFTGYYPVFPWATFFILGMLLGRLKLCDKQHRRMFLLSGLAIYISSELISKFFTAVALFLSSEPEIATAPLGQFSLGLMWLTSIDLTVPTPLSVISGIGTGITVIMVSISISTEKNAYWTKYIIIAGRNTLTLYITHIIFLILMVFLFNISDETNLPLISLSAFLFFFMYITLISFWLKNHKKGPFELLMRKFSVSNLILEKQKYLRRIRHENQRGQT